MATPRANPGLALQSIRTNPLATTRCEGTAAKRSGPNSLAQPTPSPHEIAELHRVRLTDLFAGRGRGANRDLSPDDTSGPAVFSLYLPTLGHDLFAPTAAIMDHFREVALEGRATPVVRFGEPPFAQR